MALLCAQLCRYVVCHLRVHVGAVELHVPVVEVPSPVHSTAVVLDRPKPLVHVNVHELPQLLELEHVGEFPLAGATVERTERQVISENQIKQNMILVIGQCYTLGIKFSRRAAPFTLCSFILLLFFFIKTYSNFICIIGSIVGLVNIAALI